MGEIPASGTYTVETMVRERLFTAWPPLARRRKCAYLDPHSPAPRHPCGLALCVSSRLSSVTLLIKSQHGALWLAGRRQAPNSAQITSPSGLDGPLGPCRLCGWPSLLEPPVLRVVHPQNPRFLPCRFHLLPQVHPHPFLPLWTHNHN